MTDCVMPFRRYDVADRQWFTLVPPSFCDREEKREYPSKLFEHPGRWQAADLFAKHASHPDNISSEAQPGKFVHDYSRINTTNFIGDASQNVSCDVGQDMDRSIFRLDTIFLPGYDLQNCRVALSLDLRLYGSPGRVGGDQGDNATKDIASESEPILQLDRFFGDRYRNADRNERRQRDGEYDQPNGPKSLVPFPHALKMARHAAAVEPLHNCRLGA